jgi:putative transposase
MKKPKFSDSQIINVLKQAEAGTPVLDLGREHAISSATFYKWRAKYGGIDTALMARLKELEEKNRRLKKMYAEGPYFAASYCAFNLLYSISASRNSG